MSDEENNPEAPEVEKKDVKPESPAPIKVHDIHWTAIAGFWVGLIGLIAALFFGTISLMKSDEHPKRGHHGGGWKGSFSKMRGEHPDRRPPPGGPPREPSSSETPPAE